MHSSSVLPSRIHASLGIPAASRIMTPRAVRVLVWLLAVSLFELARRW